MHYILIIISMASSGYATSTAEFSSKLACESAKKAVMESIRNTPYTKAICVSKEYTG